MSNTVITNYTDLNGPSSKADSSIVVIVNKDGSLSVDEKHLGALMSNDRSQSAGISVVRIGHDGPPDDATDSENENDVPHVTLSVDSYYDEPNSIIKYDSGADMFHSLRIETRENSLLGFQNDHCYTAFAPTNLSATTGSDYAGYDEPIIEIKSPQPHQQLPSNKKITILEQKILPKGRKIPLTTSDSVILQGNDIFNKPIPKSKEKIVPKDSESDESESSSLSSSGESYPDRDSDSDYNYNARDRTSPMKIKKSKIKPRILKQSKIVKSKQEVYQKIPKSYKSVRKDVKEKLLYKNMRDGKKVIYPKNVQQESPIAIHETKKEIPKHTPKLLKKEKKTPAHVNALLSDMTTLFSTPDVIRRVSTDAKTPLGNRKSIDSKMLEDLKDKPKMLTPKTSIKIVQRDKPEKVTKGFDVIPQIDDASLAQILQDPPVKPHAINPSLLKDNFTASNSPALPGPLSPTLDLLGLQPEEEGLTEDILMHVAHLVESSENLQEVIDKQVLGKVDTGKTSTQFPHAHSSFMQSPLSKGNKVGVVKNNPIEIVRRDGRIITLPPIEAPATRASKRKSALTTDTPPPHTNIQAEPEDSLLPINKFYPTKKVMKRPDLMMPDREAVPSTSAMSHDEAGLLPFETEDSLNSEDDPNRLWCICQQPHNNRFMICCDRCEDWFHGKCVNITKAMGQQMEEQGVEWTCPNCIKKTSPSIKPKSKTHMGQKKVMPSDMHQSTIRPHLVKVAPKSGCIVCKKPVRPNSIYCSDECILVHTQDALPTSQGTPEITPQGKPKSDSRVIVFERKTGKCLAGHNAPTAENLKTWLQKNPTFEVVRPGTLGVTKPTTPVRKTSHEPLKVQTKLNFDKIVKNTVTPQKPDIKSPTHEEPKLAPSPRIHLTPKTHTPEVSKPSTSSPKPSPDMRKHSKPILNRSRSSTEKIPLSPTTPKKRDREPEKKSKSSSTWLIRENVRKSLQEQLTTRRAEDTDVQFTEKEIKAFAEETEMELHELFRDVGVKYKAKYRSLMFNIKDRKNLSLWKKICDKSISPKQLVRLSPEELASQELAEWRDNEAKHQLELIKKSELDLLAASKTYVLKTHKGEEVIKSKTAVETELDPNMPMEDVVSALNDPSVNEETPSDTTTSELGDSSFRKSSVDSDRTPSRRNKDESRSKRKDSIADSSERRSRSTRSSDLKEGRSTRRSERKDGSRSKDRHKSKSLESSSKHKSRSRDRSRRRSRSRAKSKSKPRSKSKSRSRSHERSKKRSKSRSRSKQRSRSRRRSTRNKNRSRSKQDSASAERSKQRSKSQDSETKKSKDDYKDPEVVERPKSAMMKEVHPEYDPHEAMITSAFSDEDLRKSREDLYDEYTKIDSAPDATPVDYGDLKSPPETPSTSAKSCKTRRDKSEGESDQEPSSTVDSAALVWSGCINMVDVARFYVAAHQISGSLSDLEEDLNTELDIVGRINPDTVWDYINKMKRAGNKDIAVLRLTAANDEEKMQYIALYSYLSTRNRLGVVKVTSCATVKDLYIVPLNPAAQPPALCLPAPAAPASKHVLLAVVVRQRRKRSAPVAPPPAPAAKIARTPSPPRRREAPLPLPLPPTPQPAADIAVPPVPSSTEVAEPGNMLRNKMEQLNRQIEEQKQQILRMAQADSSVGEDQNEAYSPSRPLTPPAPMPAPVPVLADIALPSNLQEILASIQHRDTPPPKRRLRSYTPTTASPATR